MAVKVCHVTSVHHAKDVRIFHKECASLAKVYDVYLIAPNVENEVDKGVHIVGVELPESRLKRLLYLNKIYRKALEIDASIYHFHDPELMKIGLKIKKKGKKVIFDSHEDVPDQILDKPYIPQLIRRPLSKLYARIEKSLFRQYDTLITVTPHIVERLIKINPQTVMITNYPMIQKDEQPHWRNIPFGERMYVCFAGSISPHYRHERVIKCIEKTDVKYLLAGHIDHDYFEKLKILKSWDKVEYRGVVPFDKVKEIYSESFAGIVYPEYRPNAGYKRGTIGVLKMFEFMYAGIPVIATDFDLWKEIIEKNECGICVNPYKDDKLTEAISYYRNHPKMAQKHGENGRQLVVEKYNWGTQEPLLYSVYESLLGES